MTTNVVCRLKEECVHLPVEQPIAQQIAHDEIEGAFMRQTTQCRLLAARSCSCLSAVIDQSHRNVESPVLLSLMHHHTNGQVRQNVVMKLPWLGTA